MTAHENNLKTLIDIWPSLKDVREDDIKWGDEIEYILLRFRHDDHLVELAAKGTHVIEELEKEKNEDTINIQPEGYEYMVETCPSKPFASDLGALLEVEEDMRMRRRSIQNKLDRSTAVVSLSRFGMFGANDFSGLQDGITSQSVKDEAGSLITSGSRFKSALDAIANRRGHDANKKASLYEHESANSSSLQTSTTNNGSEPGLSSTSVAVDDPIFGVGGCAVQVNFGTKDLAHALHLHDQFCAIGPLMLALTAACPILKGYLIETDTKWDHLVSMVDDRAPHESHVPPRWSTSPMYIEDLSDVQLLNHPLSGPKEPESEFSKRLTEAGVPQPMAKYFAQMLCRDTIMDPKDGPEAHEDTDLTTRVERLQKHLSHIYPHIRLKLPSPSEGIPWLVEFRSMETQLTDFEIAAMVIFLELMKGCIFYHNLELRVPIRMVEDNMNRAQIANAVHEQKFWFNTTNKLPTLNKNKNKNNNNSDPYQPQGVHELSLDEIFNGQSTTSSITEPFCGLLHYVRDYLAVKAKETNLSNEEVSKIESYLEFISRRASGADPTAAKWMRGFVLQHPHYRGDSKVSQEVYYEMMCKIVERSDGS